MTADPQDIPVLPSVQERRVSSPPPCWYAHPLLSVLLILLVASAIYLPGLRSLPLADPEESRCAMIVADMRATNDYLVPHLAGQPYFEKPPLFYWLASLATCMSGQLEAGGRIVSVLAAVGVALAIWGLGRRMFGFPAGLIGALAALVCVMQFGMARWYRQEMLLSLWIALSLLCYWRIEELRTASGPLAARAGRFWYGFYAFAALGCLTKGPIGLILPLVVVVAYLLLSGQWRSLRDLLHWRAIVLFAMVASPWFAYMSLKFRPEFVQQFFIRSHLDRAGAGLGSHVFGLWFYPVVLLAGFIPWTILLPGLCTHSFPWPRLQSRADGQVERLWRTSPTVLFLWTWAVVIGVFFSFSSTKYWHYILPAFGPLCLLAGEYLCCILDPTLPAWRTWQRRVAIPAMVGAVAMTVGIVVADLCLRQRNVWIILPLIVGAAVVIAVRHSMLRNRPIGTVVALLAGMTFLGAYLPWHTMPAVYAKMSMRDEARKVAHNIPSDRPLLMLCGQKFSFALYGGRPDARYYEREEIPALAAELRKRPSVLFYFCGRDRLDPLKRDATGVQFSPLVTEANWGLMLTSPGSIMAATATAPSSIPAIRKESAGKAVASSPARNAASTSQPASRPVLHVPQGPAGMLSWPAGCSQPSSRPSSLPATAPSTKPATSAPDKETR